MINSILPDMIKEAYEVLQSCHEYYLENTKTYEEYTTEMNGEIIELTKYIPEYIAI